MFRSEIARLIAVTDCVLLIKDIDTRKVISVSDNFYRMTKLPESEIVGRTSTEIFGPQLAERVEEYDQRALQTGEPAVIDLAFADRVWTVTALRVTLDECPVIAKVAVPRLG